MTLPSRAEDALWTSAEAAQATGGRAIGRWTCQGIAIDTRAIAPGDLFVALKDKRDGHAFVADAFAKGAAAALVERLPKSGAALVVKDTLEGLRALALAARRRSPALRVAVTGSVGKTSLKEALGLIFRAAGRAHQSEKSFNNHWGAPLSLARMPRGTERAVFELGMNHAGEIRPLAELIAPHVAVITKIAPAHIENLGSLEAIADAKAEIFAGFETLGDWGAAVIPDDDALASRLAEHAGAQGAGWLVRFGTRREAEARLLSFEASGADEALGEAEIFGRRVRFRLKANAPHWGLMATAALGAAYLADTPLTLAGEAMSAFAPPAGRGAISLVAAPGGTLTVIDDAYNANPASMAAAIAALGAREPGPGGRRIVALGEMLELGAEAPALHARLAAPIEAARVDLALLVGQGMTALEEALPASRRGGWHETSQMAADALAGLVRAGDIVLVKGSNGARMNVVVERLKALGQ